MGGGRGGGAGSCGGLPALLGGDQLAGHGGPARPGVGAGVGFVVEVVQGFVVGRLVRGDGVGLELGGRFLGFFPLGGVGLFLRGFLLLDRRSGAALLLERLHQPTQALVVHGLETRQRQRGLIAQVEEEHGVAGRGAAQLEVEQALIQDADVLRGEVGEVDRRLHVGGAPALAYAHAAAGEQVEDAADGGVAWTVLGGFEGDEGPKHRILGLGVPRTKEPTAVAGHGQLRMGRTVVYQAEQGQDARPGGGVVAQAFLGGAAAGPFEGFAQTL